MEGGFIALVLLLAFSPFIIWAERAQRFRQLNPVEQNLQRASHGFTLAAFVLIAVFGMYGWSGVSLLFTNPAQALPGAIVFGGLFVYGFARFLAGVRRSAGVRDGLLASRAVLKLVIGVVVFLFVYQSVNAGIFGRRVDFSYALLTLALLGAASWCALTGAVRFMLTIGIRRKAKAPPLHPSPRGAARDASQAEAAAAMKRSGARKISLDDRRF